MNPRLTSLCRRRSAAGGRAGRLPTSAQAERELTLEQALEMGKKRNKSMVAERARLEQAQTSLSSAWAMLLPTIAAQGKYTRNYNEPFRSRQIGSRSWPDGLPWPDPAVQPAGRRHQLQRAADRPGRLPWSQVGQGEHRVGGGELRAVRDQRALRGRAGVLRGGHLRRGGDCAPLEHPGRARDARQRQDAAGRGHGHEGRRRSRRAGVAALRAGGARGDPGAPAGLSGWRR